MIFDIKRYKYKFKNEMQIFIYKVFKVMSLQKRLTNYIVKIGMKNSVKTDKNG